MYSCIDFDTGTIPEPTAVITERKRASMRLPPPRSKSPIKTFLQSPARRNPSLGPVSSPVRGSIVAPPAASVSASVRRKLDFSNVSVEDITAVNGSPQKRSNSAALVGRTAKLTNRSRLSLVRQALSESGEDDDPDYTDIENEEEFYQMLDDEEDEEVEQIEEPEEEEEPEPPKKKEKMGRPKRQDLLEIEEEEEKPRKRTRQSLEGPQPVKNKGGRSQKFAPPEEEPEEQEGEERPSKKPRRSLDTTESPKNKGGRPRKTSSTTTTTAKPPKAKTLAKSRNPKLASISEAESPQAQRGPPMPRTSHGLVILRRETPMEGTGFKQTRSGRNSIKPVAYWKNERIEYADEENEDQFGKFLLPRIKEVVRADEIEEPKRQKSKSKSTKPKKRRPEPESDEEEDEAEPWETEPGHMYGEVRNWDPEDQLGTMAEEREEELAISAAGIITREIPGASFKFAKTLTHPFFGSGMVDLPAGAVKKPKNSRKMQMVFFVFSGRVKVYVNENEFRIGKGGMWQVPRGMFPVQGCCSAILIIAGNFYSIENDYDQPARIFFAQGCEVQEEIQESQ